MSGFYLMHRGWMDHPIFGKEPLDQRSAWAWLIEHAAYKPTKHRVGGAVVDVPRGSYMTTVRDLADQWKWSKSRVDRFLRTLEKQDMICIDAGTGKTRITVCNYEEYQATRDSVGTEAGQRAGQERDKSGTQKEQGNKGNNGKKEDMDPPPRASAAVPVPEVSNVPDESADDGVSVAKDRWNEMVDGTPIRPVQVMSDKRRKHLRVRLDDCGGLDGWEVALAKIRGSPYLRGEVNGWVVTFDWAIKKENFIKIMEGNYDQRSGENGKQHRTQQSDRRAILEGLGLAADGGQFDRNFGSDGGFAPGGY